MNGLVRLHGPGTATPLIAPVHGHTVDVTSPITSSLDPLSLRFEWLKGSPWLCPNAADRSCTGD